jgi:hypothetical protein
MSIEGQATGPTKRFVWWSTDKSVADGVPSVLAGLEVVVAVGAYWAIAIYFDTTTHLWVSICVAPLLLLRSEQSVTCGARWFTSYLRRAEELEDELGDGLNIRTLALSVEFWGGMATGLIASALVSYLLTREWLVGYESWSLYWRSGVVGYVAIVAAGVAAVATVGVYSGSVGIATVLAGLLAGAVAGRGAEAVALAYAGVVAVEAVPSTARAVSRATAVTTPVMRAVFLPSIVLGVWLRTILIRFTATAYFPWSGFWNIPANFKRTLFVIDLRHPAELIPDFLGNFINTSGEMLLLLSKREGIWDTVMGVAGYLVFFIPAYLYRLSIKSTCWLYLPLVYIASERDFAWTSEHLIDRLMRGGWEWWRRILAVSTLIAFAVTTLASISAHELGDLTHGIVPPKIISPLEFMFQFDFSGRWWQYCSLAGALITGWLFLEAKEIRVDMRHANEPQRQAAVTRQVDRVKFAMRVRNVLSIALILMIGVHALLAYSPVAPYLPAYVLRGLGWFYGSYMPPIPTVS